MSRMISKRLFFVIALVLVFPALAYGDGVSTWVCPFPHARVGVFGELTTSQVNFTNVGKETATIEQFTIRDFFGDIVTDVGPSTGVPLPLNTDQLPPVDVTDIPPGANFYLESDHFFKKTSIPGVPRLGFRMSATVKIRVEEDTDSIIVGGLTRFREFDPNLGPPGGRETDSRTETVTKCVRLRGGGDDDD